MICKRIKTVKPLFEVNPNLICITLSGYRWQTYIQNRTVLLFVSFTRIVDMSRSSLYYLSCELFIITILMFSYLVIEIGKKAD